MVLKSKSHKPKGEAAAYITRSQALRRLQLPLADFRRLCIIKGIYPHEPKHRKRVNKGSSDLRTFYLLKDVKFLAHEPIIQKFRDMKIYVRRLKRQEAKRNRDAVHRLVRCRPTYTLDHVIAERLRKVFVSIKGIYYQCEIMGQTITWITPHERGHSPASKDVDFQIMVTFLDFYSTLLGFVNFRLYTDLGLFYPPRMVQDGQSKTEKVEAAPIRDRKGHKRTHLKLSIMELRRDADFDLVASLVGSIDRITVEPGQAEVDEIVENAEDESTDKPLKSALKSSTENQTNTKLFDGLNVFLNREVPREALTFCLRSFGANVSWDPISGPGSLFGVDDDCVTHEVVDRPVPAAQKIERRYRWTVGAGPVQPQWVFDSINLGRLLPCSAYMPGVTLPPHLSPFVAQPQPDEMAAGTHYISPDVSWFEKRRSEADGERGAESFRSLPVKSDHEQKKEKNEKKKKKKADVNEQPSSGPSPTKKKKKVTFDDKLIAKATHSGSKMTVREGRAAEPAPIQSEKELLRLRESMMTKKDRRLYQRIQYTRNQQRKAANRLRRKRAALEAAAVAGGGVTGDAGDAGDAGNTADV